MVGHQSDWLAMRTGVTPGKTALEYGSSHYTFAELDRLVDQLARHFLAGGVGQDSFVATLLPNNLATVCTLFAVARLGAVLVPLNTRLTPFEATKQLAQVDAGFLVYGEAFRQTAELSASGRVVLSLPTEEGLFRELLRQAGENNVPVTASSWDHDRLQSIMFTSGTTGQSKGAMLTFGNHAFSAVASAFRLGTLPDDRWLVCMPLYHVGGMAILLRACLYGITVVLQDSFDVAAVEAALAEGQVSIVSLVPTMLTRLLDSNSQRDWPRLRTVLLGGAAATPKLIADAAGRGLLLAATYGLTEAASQVATTVPGQVGLKPGSVGQPLAFSAVTICDDSGRSLPAGEVGQVIVEGPTVMKGYYADPEATAAALRTGRLHTGDLGYLDEDGDLWIVARRSDLIVSGGENVYPAEVEQALLSHPALQAVCVTGAADREWGQRVTATVVARPGSVISQEELDEYLRPRLAGYKRPRAYRFVDVLPQTASGKINRGQVAREMTADQSLAAETQ